MKRVAKIAFVCLATVLLCLALYVFGFPALWDIAHSGSGPAVENIASPVDANGNGVDDYSDLVAGARADAEAHPTYDGSYYQGGYPPADRGACTDLVWRAFKAAGYSLKDMVDADITSDKLLGAEGYERYKSITSADPNIDFRRAANLDVFFSSYAQTLPTALDNPADWQPGDIAIFDNGAHIGICSDKRDSRGIPLLLHNSGQLNREEDYLGRPGAMSITGHYRFDASQIDSSVLRYWN